MATHERVIAYVDGLNLYHGIRSANLDRYLWLDISKLASSLLRKRQKLLATKYFVARFPAQHRRAAARRQHAYLSALTAIDELEIVEGRFQSHPTTCDECGAVRQRHEEKMTDVNLAIRLVFDAELCRYRCGGRSVRCCASHNRRC